MEWIRSANLKKYDLLTAFNENVVLDWTKGPFNISIGDIVYLYVGVPHSRIMYKTICIADNILPEDVVEDRKYWCNQTEFNTSTVYIRLKKVCYIDDSRLSLENLNKKELISGRIQGAFPNKNMITEATKFENGVISYGS